MGRIDDFVETLTPEQRELHKDMIEECRIREQNIALNTAKGLYYARKYDEDIQTINQTIHTLHNRANEALDAVSTASLNLTLASFDRYRRGIE